MTTKLALTLLPDTFAICRLDREAPVPSWADSKSFFSITRTADELSIVCAQSNVPNGIKCEKDWRCLHIQGKLDFRQIGIIASLTQTLAKAQISVFVISTFDTDYLLIKSENLAKAIGVLTQAGYSVSSEGIHDGR